jgi:hypothetical protein
MTIQSAARRVRGLGECGGHFRARRDPSRAALLARATTTTVRGRGECGGHFWAPALNR